MGVNNVGGDSSKKDFHFLLEEFPGRSGNMSASEWTQVVVLYARG